MNSGYDYLSLVMMMKCVEQGGGYCIIFLSKDATEC